MYYRTLLKTFCLTLGKKEQMALTTYRKLQGLEANKFFFLSKKTSIFLTCFPLLIDREDLSPPDARGRLLYKCYSSIYPLKAYTHTHGRLSLCGVIDLSILFFCSFIGSFCNLLRVQLGTVSLQIYLTGGNSVLIFHQLKSSFVPIGTGWQVLRKENYYVSIPDVSVKVENGRIGTFFLPFVWRKYMNIWVELLTVGWFKERTFFTYVSDTLQWTRDSISFIPFLDVVEMKIINLLAKRSSRMGI